MIYWNSQSDIKKKKMSKIAMKLTGPTILSITLFGDSDKFQQIKFRTDKSDAINKKPINAKISFFSIGLIRKLFEEAFQ